MKRNFVILFLLFLIILLVGCSGTEQTGQSGLENGQTDEFIQSDNNDNDEFISSENNASDDISDEFNDSLDTDTQEPLDENIIEDTEGDITANLSGERNEQNYSKFFYSPFSGQLVNENYLRKAMMVVVENSPAARPQSGLEEASIIYEVLVEGGITRFLALYWDQIPDKIGPVRSVRPYMIEIAEEYNALLLHAGASPTGFAILAEGQLDHLDQINKSQYYWRSSDRRAPHNLYTGSRRIEDYLDKLLGQEYQNRFKFQQVSIIKPEDKKTDFIRIPFWGGTTVIYKYNTKENQYYRYYGFMETPHLLDNNNQINAKNLIIQYTKTRQIDDVGRLEMELEDRGRALIFRDGIVIDGFWEKDEDRLTKYYNIQGERISLNPGQTWIEIIPYNIDIEYEYSLDKKNDNDNEDSNNLVNDQDDKNKTKDNKVKDNNDKSDYDLFNISIKDNGV